MADSRRTIYNKSANRHSLRAVVQCERQKTNYVSLKIYWNGQELLSNSDAIIVHSPTLHFGHDKPLLADCKWSVSFRGVRMSRRQTKNLCWRLRMPKQMSRKQLIRRREVQILRLKKIVRENTAAGYAAGKALNGPAEPSGTRDSKQSGA
jgi:hypothetical protein